MALKTKRTGCVIEHEHKSRHSPLKQHIRLSTATLLMVLARAVSRLRWSALRRTGPAAAFRSLTDEPFKFRVMTASQIDEANEELMEHFLVTEDPPHAAAASMPTDPKHHSSAAAAAAGHEEPAISRPRGEDPAGSWSEGAGAALGLTHVDDKGQANMVDVSQKAHTVRTAVATASLRYSPSTHARALRASQATDGCSSQEPGRVRESGEQSSHDRHQLLLAQLAGIRAAKLTSLFIPLCHNINISKVNVKLDPSTTEAAVHVTATATAVGQTGVEMEALAAAAFAAMNLLGSVQDEQHRAGRITDLQLQSKSGGKSGDYSRAVLHGHGDGAEHHQSTASRTTSQGTAGGSTSEGRTATARLSMPVSTWGQLVDNVNKKGDVIAVAQLAGVMAADQTAMLFPAAFRQGIDARGRLKVDVSLDPTYEGYVHIKATATPKGELGAEALAMTAAAVSALTVYDMCKASSKSIVIEDIHLDGS